MTARSSSRVSLNAGASSASSRKSPCASRVPLHPVGQVPSPGESEVLERPRVHGEVRGRGPVLGAHVRQGRPIGDREGGQTGSEELHEPADDPVRAEHLGQREDEIGRGRARGELPRHAHADHIRLRQERRLPQHRRLRLDPAHAPPEDAEAVHHRRVGVGAHQGVREGHAVPDGHDLAEVLQIHLVADARAGRHDAEPVEGLLRPSEQRVALTVPAVLPVDVGLVGVPGPEEVDLDRVVDDQVHGDERIDGGRVPPGARDGAAHRRQVDDRWDAGEVLHQDASRHERDVGRRLRPPRERPDVLVRDVSGPRAAEEVLEKDPDGVGKTTHVGHACLGEPRERVEVEGSVGRLERQARACEFRCHPCVS